MRAAESQSAAVPKSWAPYCLRKSEEVLRRRARQRQRSRDLIPSVSPSFWSVAWSGAAAEGAPCGCR